ncbi:MAG: hypothetical protein HRT47_03310 [Candidatus Caenarcaniphilales bacterium]|nr:hypothetical protein [Candidatus Caenarcaniphilales bacterium]
MRASFTLRLIYLTFISLLLASAPAIANFEKLDIISREMPIDFDFSAFDSFSYSESFDLRRDPDFYKISIPKKGYLDIKVIGQVNSRIELFNSEEKVIAFDSENGTENNARLIFEIEETGIYYIKLINENEVQGFYDLEVSLLELSELNDDYDNKIEDPNFKVELNASLASISIVGSINYTGDTDNFKLSLLNKASVSFKLDAGNTNDDYRIIVYNSDLEVIDLKEASSLIDLNLKLATGDYLVSVQGESNSDLGYELTLTPTNINTDEDPDIFDNFSGQVFNLNLNNKRFTSVKVDSEINFVNDIDTFKINVPTEALLVVRTRYKKSRKRVRKRDQKLNMILYDDKLRIIGEKIGKYHFVQRNKISPGEYFIQLSSPNSKTGDYHIKIILKN